MKRPAVDVVAVRKHVARMSRKKLLELLGEQSRGLWRDEASGYGPSATLVSVEEDGLYECGTETEPPVEGPFELSEEEIQGIKAGIASGEADAGDEEVQLVQGGCRPGVAYYRLASCLNQDADRRFFDTLAAARAEADDLISSLVDHELVELWEDMDDGDLRRWAEVALLMDAGVTSIYEVLAGAGGDECEGP